jgi:hypothetical protein
MKTLCFLHRLELTDLFGPVALAMPVDIRCVHLAYDRPEAEQLAAIGIPGVPVFKQLLAAHLKDTPPGPGRLAEIERDIVAATGGAFGLNAAIQSDRALRDLSYEDCLRLADAYYSFWQHFLEEHDVDHVVHETVALLFHFMAAVAVERRGGSYLCFIMSPAEPGAHRFIVMQGVELFSPDITRKMAQPPGTRGADGYTRDDLQSFLQQFRTSIAIFFGGMVPVSVAWPILMLKALRNFVRWHARNRYLDPLIDAVEVWHLRQNVAASKIRNLIDYRRFVRFDKLDESQTYWFYPLHLEPEAVVLYQAHGVYTNQVKLIENIAAQLPPGHLLYVKDHPHDIGYRNAADYLRLNAVPNIRLLPASVPGKQIIRNAFGVITINGTAGFEAMLMRKPVVAFGRNFYTDYLGVRHLDHVRDLRATLTELTTNNLPDDAALLDFLEAYMGALNPGMVSFFAGAARKTGIDLEQNAHDVAAGLSRTVRRI